MRRVQLNLPEELYQEIRREAYLRGISFAAVVRERVDEGLRRLEAEERKQAKRKAAARKKSKSRRASP
jgi:hypothetical protein